MKVCIVGAAGKLGQYMMQHALDRDYGVVGVCREQSVGKLAADRERVNVVPGATNDGAVIGRGVEGCDGVLVVLVPRGGQITRRERRRRCSNTRGPGRASSSRVGGWWRSAVDLRRVIRAGRFVLTPPTGRRLRFFVPNRYPGGV
jgi:hypothetical protein